MPAATQRSSRPSTSAATPSAVVRPRSASAAPRRRSSTDYNTIHVKLSVARRAAAGEDVHALALENNVSVRTVKRWRQSTESLAQFGAAYSDATRCTTRPPHLVELDRQLYEWLLQERRVRQRVYGAHIQEKARQLNAQLGGPDDFKASNGWLMKFMRRHGLGAAANQPSAGRAHDDQHQDVDGEAANHRPQDDGVDEAANHQPQHDVDDEAAQPLDVDDEAAYCQPQDVDNEAAIHQPQDVDHEAANHEPQHDVDDEAAYGQPQDDVDDEAANHQPQDDDEALRLLRTPRLLTAMRKFMATTNHEQPDNLALYAALQAPLP